MLDCKSWCDGYGIWLKFKVLPFWTDFRVYILPNRLQVLDLATGEGIIDKYCEWVFPSAFQYVNENILVPDFRGLVTGFF